MFRFGLEYSTFLINYLLHGINQRLREFSIAGTAFNIFSFNCVNAEETHANAVYQHRYDSQYL